MASDPDDFYANMPDNRKFKDTERMIEEGAKIKSGGQSLHKKSSQPEKGGSFNGAAAAMSFIMPGLGQVYKGQVWSGLAFFFGSIIGFYLLVVPGFIAWIVGVFHAGMSGNSE
ncbi:MAG: hypothetical protein HUJ26_16665 [Planctomycetaceae bacterium]|nr:hypothetical protein [Planctomycetaceae bacterium]